MRPIKTERAPFTYRLQGGGEENDLPCAVDRDAGTVTSYWEAAPDDLDPDLTPAAAELRLWVWRPASIEATVRVGDLTLAQGNCFRDADGLWCYCYVLTGDSLALLQVGALVEVTIPAIPPPPIAVGVVS